MMRAVGLADFPIRPVLLGIAAMVLIAVASAATSWVVSSRVRDLVSSQMAVISGASQLQRQRELLELFATSATESGDERFAVRYHRLQPELRAKLRELQLAIDLPESRETLSRIERVEREISRIEYRALNLALSGQRTRSEALFDSARYRALLWSFRAGLSEIEERSRAYADSSRRETNLYLGVNLAASLISLLLLGIAWAFLLRPTRAWAKQLADARARAEQATAAKSEFLAVISHEMRTPLNGIIGFAELLLSEGDLRRGDRRYAELIQSSGKMLLTVINDVLDFSKIEAGRIELCLEPFALERMVDNSVSIVRASAEAKGLSVRVEIDPSLGPYFVGDENRLRQVLLNLLNNAVKFTSEGGVVLDVRKVTEPGQAGICFTVTDTGPGIAAERQGELFEPFAQADASITRRYGGSGLGLSISKRLVELMGGRIGFRSEAGVGSSFWFSVPLEAAEQPPLPEYSLRLPTAASGLSILLVEDLPINRELACAMLSRAGHRVDIAEDGEEALRKVQEKAYDLVLMDIQMPRMDGITAARRIRLLPPPAGRVPIVAMTANVLPRQVMEFRAAGMNGHIPKPVTQRELEAAVQRAVRGGGEEPDDRGEEPPAFDRDAFEAVKGVFPPERLRFFAEELESGVRALAGAVPADRQQMAGEAHKLASQAGMLALPRLAARAAALEAACLSSRSVEPALDRLREAAGDVRAQLVPLLADRQVG